MVYPDEGHGFAKPTNNIAFNAVTENFLAKCLGGRAGAGRRYARALPPRRSGPGGSTSKVVVGPNRPSSKLR